MSTLVQTEAEPAAAQRDVSADNRRRIFAILGASSGNLVEWYDFYTYAFTAIYFAPVFFPAGDQTTPLLNTAGVFAAGFLMRPIEYIALWFKSIGHETWFFWYVTVMVGIAFVVAIFMPDARRSGYLQGEGTRD